MTTTTPLTDDWIETEDRRLDVKHQTDIKNHKQKEERLEKVDIYVKILYDIVWVGIVICIWMVLTQFVSVLKLLWDILAIIGCTVGITRIIYKIYTAAVL